MAQGYARATGKVGVAIATSGPGATNLVTPIADAYLDSTPIVCITGQVPTHLIGTDAFQEADITGHHHADRQALMAGEGRARISRGRSRRRSTSPAPAARPGADRRPQGRASWRRSTSPTRARSTCPGYKPSRPRPPQADHHRRRGDPGGRAAGVLRRRRRRQRRRRPRPADPSGRGGADARGDHADGQGRLPRLAPAVPRPARDARLQGRQLGDEPRRSADRLRIALRRPRDRQARLVRARRQGHPHGRRPGRDRQEPRRPDPDRRARSSTSCPSWRRRIESRMQRRPAEGGGMARAGAGLEARVPVQVPPQPGRSSPST